MAGRQGRRRQERRRQQKGEWSRLLAFLHRSQGAHQVPVQPERKRVRRLLTVEMVLQIPQSSQQLQIL